MCQVVVIWLLFKTANNMSDDLICKFMKRSLHSASSERKAENCHGKVRSVIKATSNTAGLSGGDNATGSGWLCAVTLLPKTFL